MLEYSVKLIIEDWRPIRFLFVNKKKQSKILNWGGCSYFIGSSFCTYFCQLL